MMVLKDLLTVRPDIRVVLMSATLDAQLFDAPVIHIPGTLLHCTDYLIIIIIKGVLQHYWTGSVLYVGCVIFRPQSRFIPYAIYSSYKQDGGLTKHMAPNTQRGPFRTPEV